jgi:hypothetical protein
LVLFKKWKFGQKAGDVRAATAGSNYNSAYVRNGHGNRKLSSGLIQAGAKMDGHQLISL